MQLADFEHQMDRLRMAFGEKSYPRNGERDKAIWDRVKAYPREQFEYAVGHLIGENFSPPSLSKITEALSMYRRPGAQSKMQDLPPADSCDACKDHGFGFVGDTVVACQCQAGRRLSPEALTRAQGNYNKGRAFLKRGREKASFFHELPYDPSERIGGGV